MATTVTNSATLNYNSGTNALSSTSNVATTVLIDAAGIEASKQSHNTVWRPGENLTYVVQIGNSGTEPLYNITITDDLGGVGNNYLTYVEDSILLNQKGTLTSLTPTSTNPLTIVVPGPVEYLDVITVTYVAKVNSNIDTTTVTDITNTATIQANVSSPTGRTITIGENPSVTLPLADYADVSISKTSSLTRVSSGETFDYVFELTNTGNIDATNVVITDVLPSNYTVTGVTSTTNGVTTAFTVSDYTVGTGNVLTLPTGTAISLTVPAATTAGAGVTTVNVTGYLTSTT